MAVGHAPQHVLEVGERLDVIELCGRQQRGDDCPALGPAIGSGEQMVLAAKGNLPVILPISGKRSRFIIAGIRFLGVGSGCTAANTAPVAASFISRQRPA